MPGCRIVEEHFVFSEALNDNKMIEIPKNDERRLDLAKILNSFAKTFGQHSIVPCGPHDIPSVASVSGDSAFPAEGGCRYDAPVILQDHSERSRPAFGRFQLQHGRSFDSQSFR